jgi:glycerol 2-dehydrogenase (NADP+)
MMAAQMPHFKLNNGTTIPSVGMGFVIVLDRIQLDLNKRRCWMGTPGGGQRVYDMCASAIKAGYRHFDTADGYGALLKPCLCSPFPHTMPSE